MVPTLTNLIEIPWIYKYSTASPMVETVGCKKFVKLKPRESFLKKTVEIQYAATNAKTLEKHRALSMH